MNKTTVNLDGLWLPRAASTLAPDIDGAWNLAMWLSVFFFVGIVGAMSWFAFRYRRRSQTDVTSKIDHNTPLEITWTIIPSIMCVVIFLVGFKGYIHASIAPAEAFEVRVTGEKWLWTFAYPNGVIRPNELRVPKGKPVRLVMSSKDVIHSFYVPEFRVKADVIPGLYTTLWFEATEVGDKQVFCTEYCGTGHSDMLAKIVVMEQPAFNEWLEKSGQPAGGPSKELGEKLFAQFACITCHSLDGSPKVGPTLQKILGKNEPLADGTTVQVDENYLRESILVPAAKVVKGFPPIMPAFKGVLKDDQVDALILFLKDK